MIPVLLLIDWWSIGRSVVLVFVDWWSVTASDAVKKERRLSFLK